MQELSKREIILQNLLAQAATLLFKTSKALNPLTQEELIIQCEEWFVEAPRIIIACLAETEKRPTPRPVAIIDVKWKSAPTLPDDHPLKYFLG